MADDAPVTVELGVRPPRVTPSASLFVVVGMPGAMVPAYDESPAVPLGLPGLLFLQRLRAGIVDTVDGAIDSIERDIGHDVSALLSLAEELRRRALLVAKAGAVTDAPDAPHFGATDVVDHDQTLVVSLPALFTLGSDGFELHDHAGRVVARLTAVELHATVQFCRSLTPTEAYQAQAASAGALALSEADFDAMVGRLLAAHILVPFDEQHPDFARAAEARKQRKDRNGRRRRIAGSENRRVAAQEKLEAELSADTGMERIRVVPVDSHWMLPPAALGYLVAYAKAYDGGRLNDSYVFVPRFYYAEDDLEAAAQRRGIFLLSNYVWNVEHNMAFSRMVKAAHPDSITIHGGPSTPKYAEDADTFFADEPHVDIAVHGEGEETFAEILVALEPSLRNGRADLTELADVAGLTYRTPDGCRRTGSRDRIADLDSIASPILTGLFDGFIAGPTTNLIIETNRGCPYGCTFCDWGSATLSRIRQFDIERVFAEIEWMGVNQIQNLALADANFGIFKRDVEIAEKIVQVKAEYGFPQMVGPNYAKNTVKHLRPIIEIFADAGILAEGKVSLQSMDPDTLKVIRRRNIKTEKYNQLASEFQDNRLPLSVDIMMGLPGATSASFRDDLQGVINRDVIAFIHQTRLLPNSPMNEASYRREHGIVADAGDILRETNSYTRDEFEEMNHLRHAVYLFDTAGSCRHVAKFVRQETGVREIDFYTRLVTDVLADQEGWPSLSFSIRAQVRRMLPPGSWSRHIDELRRYLVERCGVADDSALATVLDVQLAVLPSKGRDLPVLLSIPHDYAAWHQEVIDCRSDGHHDDWHELTPRLREFGPGTLAIEDPDDLCDKAMGQDMDTFLQRHLRWELASSVCRPRIDVVGDPAQ